ncbi:phospholipase D-like domain-containing protein [Hamadaea tsunoensis]|uniref:phospholipase D-like domain-containing protein n=1 Tax=Hamadaea tsunoensis TaxID=53368 RepID=UPI0004288DE8|nr:phospholipase D-like domain-containing protein [Hamadaea tsunoensis]
MRSPFPRRRGRVRAARPIPVVWAGVLLALATASAASLAPAAATANTTSVSSGTVKVLFLDPDLDPVTDTGTPGVSDYLDPASNKGTYEDNGLLDELNALVGAAASGSTIYGSVYTDTSTSLVTSLVNASAYATVNLVVEACPDGVGSACTPSSGVQSLITAAATHPGLHVTQCRHSCFGADGIDHNKFWVFGALTDGRTDLVVQTSYNPTSPQKQMFNNLVEVTGNTALAAGYRAYWNRLAAGATQYETGDLNAGAQRVWFFPRNVGSAAENSEIAAVWGTTAYKDLVAAAIDDVTCPGGTVKVAMWDFDDARSDIIDALAKKADAGCTVQVATGEHQDGLAALGDRGVSAYAMSPGGCRDSWFAHSGGDRDCEDGAIHSKFLLVNGVSRKDGAAHSYVYTGSENYTDGALRKNDEAMMRLSDAAVYNGYSAAFDRIVTAAVKISPSAYPAARFGTVNTVAAGNQQEPASAAYVDAAGHHVVYVAYDSDAYSAGRDEVWLARYVDGVQSFDLPVRGPYTNPPGQTTTSLCRTSGSGSTWDFRNPSVGVDAAGNAVVAWQDDNDGNGYYDLTACRITGTGTLKKAAYTLNGQHDGQQTSPVLAVTGDGRFAVAWADTSDNLTPQTHTIRYAAFSATDAKLTPTGADGYDVLVAGGTAGAYASPALSVNDSGQAVIAWADDADGNGSYNIRAKTDGLAGSFTAAAIAPNAGYTTGQQTAPAVAIAPSGLWYAAWQDDHGCVSDAALAAGAAYRQLVCVRAYDPGNVARFAPTPVSGPFYELAAGAAGPAVVSADVSAMAGPQSDPAIAVDAAGDAVVAWTEAPGSTGIAGYADGLDVWARGIDPDAKFATGFVPGRFAENRLSVWTANDEDQPAVAVGADGLFAVAYADDWDGNGSTQLRLRSGFPD